jgi:outer membrane protein assembly factor BamB
MLLDKVEDKGGHALIFGGEQTTFLDALLANSNLHLTVVEQDAKWVTELRYRYDAAGLYGSRITVHVGDPLSFQAPPYFAQLVIVDHSVAHVLRNPAMLRAAYASVRPYGGLMYWPADPAEGTTAIDTAALEKATVQTAATHTLVIREGALPGAADWTHQYGDIGNTVKSDDTRVRAPLGVLWFGGSSNLDVLPRHGHGPPEQVVNGRLFIEGMNSLSARDVYTGRVLWKHDFGDLGTYGIYYNETYADTPLSITYNQKHIPGANGRGSNYASTADAVYVAVHGHCEVLDARTGELRRKIALRDDEADPAQWGFIGVYGDLLIGGDDFARYSLRLGSGPTKSTTDDYSASAGLAVYDRHDGRLLWRLKARHSFLHNAIVAGGGRIYCLDKLTTQAEGLLERRGAELPKDYRLVALDARTGAVVWQQEANVFGTWLGYSAQHALLLQAGAKASDRLLSEAGAGMAAYRGKDGGVLWQDLKRSYTGPCILHNEIIFTGANSYSNSGGAFNLLTGEPHLVTNPLTGKQEPWRLNRTYGCNTIIASEHLLTFRSGAAGYYDLDSMSGTGNLGGFKSGCTSNLVAANGVLNAPDYTRTCSCAYQNQTSLALIHMPEMEMWTYSQFGFDGQQGDRILRAGLNFGAPGNRRAPDGTLWLEYPPAGAGNTAQFGVEGLEKAAFFRHHTAPANERGGGYAWVGSSGLIGEGEIVITPSLRRPFIAKPVKTTKVDDDDDEKGGDKTAKKPVLPVGPPPAPQKQEPLLKLPYPPLPHTVRLYFSEPENRVPGARVFSVALQGERVLENFDIAAQSGAPGETLVREFHGVEIGSDLRITLAAASGSTAPPVLNGVEFIAETPDASSAPAATQ